MEIAHIYIRWPQMLCGAEVTSSTLGILLHPGSTPLEHLIVEEHVCPKCLERVPLAELAEMDLGDEAPAAKQVLGPCTYCGYRTGGKANEDWVCTPCYSKRWV